MLKMLLFSESLLIANLGRLLRNLEKRVSSLRRVSLEYQKSSHIVCGSDRTGMHTTRCRRILGSLRHYSVSIFTIIPLSIDSPFTNLAAEAVGDRTTTDCLFRSSPDLMKTILAASLRVFIKKVLPIPA